MAMDNSNHNGARWQKNGGSGVIDLQLANDHFISIEFLQTCSLDANSYSQGEKSTKVKNKIKHNARRCPIPLGYLAGFFPAHNDDQEGGGRRRRSRTIIRA
jgi:hypothetical protein